MKRDMQRLSPFAAVVYGAVPNLIVPLLPAAILLVPVQVPGVSVVPPGVAIALLALLAFLGATFLVRIAIAPRQDAPVLVPLCAWLAAALLSALLGFDPRAGLVFFGIFALEILWHLAVLRYYPQAQFARAFVYSLVLACCLASLAAICMAVLRWPTSQYVIGHGRAIGTFILPGELAGYLVVLLPIVYGIALVTRRHVLRTLCVATLVCGGVALVLTFSRAGWVSLGVGAAFFAATRAGRFRTGALAAVAILVFVFVALVLAFNVDHNPSENFTRLAIWQAALQIVDRFPLTGVGPFDFSRLYAVVRAPDGDVSAFHAHSVYLTFLTEIGVVGVATALWAWLRFWTELRKRLESARVDAALLATAILAGLVGSLVQGFIDTVSVVIFGLWLPTMAFALTAARHGLVEETA
jgi:putative inorganic carbon (HCO3(-)) transporter